MSFINLANSKNWFEEVAVKTFKYKKGFLDETDMLLTLRHPGVPAVYGVCHENYSIVAEYMESDLNKLLEEDARNIRFIRFKDRLSIAAQVEL